MPLLRYVGQINNGQWPFAQRWQISYPDGLKEKDLQDLHKNHAGIAKRLGEADKMARYRWLQRWLSLLLQNMHPIQTIPCRSALNKLWSDVMLHAKLGANFFSGAAKITYSSPSTFPSSPLWCSWISSSFKTASIQINQNLSIEVSTQRCLYKQWAPSAVKMHSLISGNSPIPPVLYYMLNQMHLWSSMLRHWTDVLPLL